MKHKPITITLRELMARTPESTISERVAADLGIGTLAAHDKNCVCGGEPDDVAGCGGYRNYTDTELETPIRVSWPEHISIPRLNGDGNYQLA